MTDLHSLIIVAEQRGYRVIWHRGGPKAAWLPHRNAVTLRTGMSDPETLCALAHELGHAHYNDPAGHHGLNEQRADKFAAQLLVSPTEYAAAEALYGPHPARIANELGVTVNIIQTWASNYQKQTA